MSPTDAQRAVFARLLTDFAPGGSVTAEREEPHDGHLFVAIYTEDGELVLDTVVEADGRLPDEQYCEECGAFAPETRAGDLLSRRHLPSCSLHDADFE